MAAVIALEAGVDLAVEVEACGVAAAGEDADSKEKMNWLLRYRIKEYFHSSHWFAPMVGLILGIAMAPITRWVDGQTKWTLANYSPEGARAILGVLTGAMLTITLFVFTMLLLAVQIASAQLTPRIIAGAFRNRPTRLASGIFIFSFIYSLAIFGRIDQTVPQLPVFIGILSSVLSIGAFLYLIEFFAKSLRPISVMTKTSLIGQEVIDQVYPRLLEGEAVGMPATRLVREEKFEVVTNLHKGGTLLALDVTGLMGMAKKREGVIELLPQVGDFVSKGEPVFRLYGGAGGISAKSLLQSVAFGPERTLTQDPAFAFRIIVDISIRALSPAINDPTTAALGLDQLQHLLYQVGRHRLKEEGYYDDSGNLRLLIRTPNWEDFVELAVSEIRWYGADSFQVNRRLKALLEHLMKHLPAQRIAVLNKEMEMLQHSIAVHFPEIEDRKRAEVSDYQGFGGTAPLSNS